MTEYRYVQAKYDYGPRKATLGLCFHGAEAEAGVVTYLSRDPARGVSANFVCERRTGRMVQMLDLDHASGSMNPRDRSTNKAYYGHDHLVDVLGDYWTDPNAAVISVEIEMYAKSGPDGAQVASLIEWSADMAVQYPSIQGAIGHADQTDTKPCPGTTAAMRSVFDAIGGHGLWSTSSGGSLDMAIGAAGGVTSGFRAHANAGLDFFADANRTQRLGELSKDAELPYIGNALGETAPTQSKAVLVSTATAYADGVVRPTIVYVDDQYLGDPYKVAPPDPTPAPEPPSTTVLGPGLYEVK